MPPGPHHGDAVTGRQRLGLVVGDEHRRRAGRPQQLDRPRSGSAPAGSGRGWRTVRRAASAAVPVPARGPGRPAGAHRRRARAGSGRRARPSPTRSSQWSQRDAALVAPQPSAGRRPRSGPPSGGGTGRAPGTPGRCDGAPDRAGATRRRRRRRRGGSSRVSTPISPATSRSSVDLPHPLGPTRASSSPSSSVQVDVVDGDGGPERLRHAVEAQRRATFAHRRRPPVRTSSRRLSSATGTSATAMIVSAGRAACSKRDSEARL